MHSRKWNPGEVIIFKENYETKKSYSYFQRVSYRKWFCEIEEIVKKCNLEIEKKKKSLKAFETACVHSRVHFSTGYLFFWVLFNGGIIWKNSYPFQNAIFFKLPALSSLLAYPVLIGTVCLLFGGLYRVCFTLRFWCYASLLFGVALEYVSDGKEKAPSSE